MSNRCIFSSIRDCPNPNQPLIPVTTKRKDSIKTASKKRKDELHTKIRDNGTIHTHESCVKSYTSKEHIRQFLKRKENNDSESPQPKKTRNSVSSFNFKVHCLFCGHICAMKPDKKNPSRWRPAYLVRTVDPKNPYKTVILNTCAKRNDAKADEVALRVNGAPSDLHSAEARYHDECRKDFMGVRNVQSIVNASINCAGTDMAFQKTCTTMSNSPEKVWSSVELYAAYKADGGTHSRRDLISKVREHFGEKVLILSSPGIASIIIFRTNASSLLNVVKDDSEEVDLIHFAKTVKSEIKALPVQKTVYQKRVSFQTANNDVSSTVNAMLKAISPKFHNSLSGALIGNIITSVVSNRTTTLQVALGLLANKQKLIQRFFDYGITCSPDEMRRFKISAAADCAKKKVSTQISTKKGGLIQVSIDNFDTPNSSQNGLKQTHSLATIITQPEKSEVDIKNMDVRPETQSDVEDGTVTQSETEQVSVTESQREEECQTASLGTDGDTVTQTEEEDQTEEQNPIQQHDETETHMDVGDQTGTQHSAEQSGETSEIVNGIKKKNTVEHAAVNITEDDPKPETFPRLKKSDLKDVELPDIPLHFYDGPKKPSMPKHTYMVYGAITPFSSSPGSHLEYK